MKTTKRPILVADDDPDWSEFWRLYPRRQAKLDARKAWAHLDAGPGTVAVILAALVWQAPVMGRDGYSFIPLPATWLRGRRWEDEQPSTAERMLKLVAPPWQGWDCPHVEPCQNRLTCDLRTAQGRPRKADPRQGFTGLEGG